MKITVDMKLCEAYGECVFAAPDVFELDDDDEKVKVLADSPDDEKRSEVEKAAEVCPTSAITIEG